MAGGIRNIASCEKRGNLLVVIMVPSKSVQLEQNLIDVAKGPLNEENLDWVSRICEDVCGRKGLKK